MATIHRILAAGLLLGALLLPADAQEVTLKKAPHKKAIDLVICLDASGSMDGLINSARQRIWSIVNDLALAKPAPRLRVAVLSYGNDGHDPIAGWVKIETDLTDDLDLVSNRLFAIRTHGGTELVARVIRTGLNQLSWNREPDSLKLIVVAGNESANQDQLVSFRDECRKAIARGIMINSIYCVWHRDTGVVVSEWQEVARLSDGHFATIDQNRGTISVATPFDDQLKELSTALNATYVPFGKEGKKGWSNQQAQDVNAERIQADAAARRARSKASVLYFCRWCLVDATRNNAVKLAEVKKEDLPKALQAKTLEELQTYLDKTWEERAGIQKQINELHKKRQEFVSGELKKKSLDEGQAFDVAVRRAIRAQAAKKGYAFDG
jgi:Mg-chelatase subunit ChlD/uncharacterized coiled-coil protein SlyX